MRRTFPARVVLALALGQLLVWTAWAGYAQQPPAGEVDPRFTGTTSALPTTGVTPGRRRFEPGARTNWHSHERGQLLLIEEGRARFQKRGEAMKELAVGESVFTAPGVVHWHGAVPTEPMTHLNVGFGGVTTWLDKVIDEEYSGRGAEPRRTQAPRGAADGRGVAMAAAR